MPKVVQRGLFTTHRGVIVKRSAIAAVVLIVGLTVASNASKGHARAETGTPAVASTSLSAQPVDGSTSSGPVVASYIANPFSPQSSSFYQIGAGSTSTDSSASNATSGTQANADTPSGASVSDGQPTSEPTVPNEANAIKQAAQQFAPKWATYSSSESAPQFVATLPGLAPGAATSISKSISGSWSRRFDQTQAFIGTLSGSVPIVDSYDAAAGTARVSVAVDQEAVGSEDAQNITTRTYHVDLKRYADSDGTPEWGIIDVSGV